MSIHIKTIDSLPVNYDQRKCGICCKPGSSYSCPRCNVSYCSLICYKDPVKHLNCSENFYQDQVIAELKMCKLEGDDDKAKMIEILKKLNKQNEKTQILDGLDEEKVDSDSNQPALDLTDDELIRAYEHEVNKWKPWWHKYNKPKLTVVGSEETQSFVFNKCLTKKAQKIDVSKVNPLILNDILGLFYAYTIVASVYQIGEEPPVAADDEDGSLEVEMLANFFKIEAVLKEQLHIKNHVNLTETLRDSIKVIIGQADLLDLKEHLSQPFLIGLIDEVVLVCRSPLVLLKFISSFYDLLEKFLKKQSVNDITQTKISQELTVEKATEEKYLNVFFLNKKITEIIKQPTDELKKTSRVEILTRPGRLIQKPTKSFAVKENTPVAPGVKLMLRRLEFYFKWLNLNRIGLKSDEKIEGLLAIKELMIREFEQFSSETKFIGDNLNKLRQFHSQNSGVLIEEI